MTDKIGRVPTEPGSREPSPAVSALSGFDPSRITVSQYGRRWFHAYYDGEFVCLGEAKRQTRELAMQKLSSLHVPRQPAKRAVSLSALRQGDAVAADAIATEAGTAETAKHGSVHEGAGRNGIAQTSAEDL